MPSLDLTIGLHIGQIGLAVPIQIREMHPPAITPHRLLGQQAPAPGWRVNPK
jgi:hypothetical protein